jgi:predicted transcriptional regulator
MDEKTLIIDVAAADDVKERMKDAFRGIKDVTPQYTFLSPESLLTTLTAKRWALIEALTGAGPLSVRELARRVGRDVKGVHTDARKLALCGLIDKTGDGKLLFPYDKVRVEFALDSKTASMRIGPFPIPGLISSQSESIHAS